MYQEIEKLKSFKYSGRIIIYSLILISVIIGHYFLMKISFELFNELNRTLRPMFTYFCLAGAILLFISSGKKGGRAQKMYALTMFFAD